MQNVNRLNFKNITKILFIGVLSIYSSISFGMNKNETNSNPLVKKEILDNFNKWKGTKYKWGGTTKKGIDCSAFIGKVYKEGFGLDLPRTTADLKYEGKHIKKEDLKVGDMVFFRKNKHVGIYVGNNEFVHSSSSRGVVKASLNDKYYSKSFTQGRRIIN